MVQQVCALSAEIRLPCLWLLFLFCFWRAALRLSVGLVDGAVQILGVGVVNFGVHVSVRLEIG